MSYVQVAVVGLNAFQQVQGGNAARAGANVQGDQLDYQARIEQENALKMAAIIRRAGQRQMGQARGALAASGVKVDEGSALDIQQQIQHDSEGDAFQALLEGSRKARGLQVDAASVRAGGRLAQAAANVNAFGTILGGGYQAMRSNGWRTNGPGFSGGQQPAPIETRYVPKG